MNRKHILPAACLVFASVSGLNAQQAIAPPPRPTDSGPSLAVTMQFLRDKLNDIGKVTFIGPWQDLKTGANGSNTFVDEVNQVRADPSQCRIDFHFKTTRDGTVTTDGDFWFSLREAQDVVVKPMDQNINDVNASVGQPNYVEAPTTPPVTALLVRRPHNLVNMFPFTDAGTADRVAKAFTHAIELCGGGNKEPF